MTIPVVGASFADGAALAQAGSTASIVVDPPESRPQVNVIAELPGANNNNVVMAGAHLDSVQAGPGINDNGSGSAALLEVAENIAKLKPQNTLRFAWWGAEEAGLIGSTQYVNGLSQAERDRIALYLNFDMVGSPNYVFMVYDGDTVRLPGPAGGADPAGSVQIEDLFESYYTLAGERYDDAQFSGRSDYQAFILNGIPAGGLFTGAEVVKTPAQQAIWGGTAGATVRPVLPPGVRHVRQQQRPRLEREQRRHRLRRAHLRLLDRDRERCPGQEGARELHDPAAGRAGGHRRRRRTALRRSVLAVPAHTNLSPVSPLHGNEDVVTPRGAAASSGRTQHKH